MKRGASWYRSDSFVDGTRCFISLGEGLWMQLCKQHPMEQRDASTWVSTACGFGVREGGQKNTWQGPWGTAVAWGCAVTERRAHHHTQGAAWALSVVAKAGQPVTLAAGTAGLGGTQVTNWTVNILRWLWFIVQIRSAEKILGDWTKRQAALADKWTDHFVLRNNL